ncbi:hypothetical protein BN2475_450137 [Paraburkholderia ribeironis]|uniref:Uncharacterized protein n=1 Tax=Paraburkholderia ribeironis TaxID=1247936 RepID=A0A1N7S920_9BURK|nr:hypothetical protein BN2475_450137 [Paraburkholderia ribeironis]
MSGNGRARMSLSMHCGRGRIHVVLVNPQFRAIACPDNFASKLSERDYMPHHSGIR